MRSLVGGMVAFVFDFGLSKQIDLDTATVDGTSAWVVVPTEVIDQLGDGWTWRATITGGGLDLDACPNG